MMQLPRLPLDINVPPGVLSRRGGVTISGHIIRTFLERRTAETTVDSAQQNAVFVRISEDAALASSGTSPSLMAATSHRGSSASPLSAVSTSTSASRRLSEVDRLLLDVLDTGRCRSRHTGRFLTMHKRRRKRLTTRSLNQDPGILDDIFHGQVQCVLQNVGNWRFNAFTLETVTGGRSLPVLCVHLFYWYGLLQHFKLDVVRVWKLFSLIEEGYHSTNPYHNSIHATDVTQAMHCFLQEEKIKRNLSPLEIMGSLIGAVTHDLDHPGVNQPFLVATSNHLAALYENTSVLENHHWRSAIGCLLESGVSEQLAPEMRPELESHISSLILATDITRQQEFLTKFKLYLDDNLLEMRHAEHRHFILQIALKCADISNPCRPWDISRKWSHKVCEEFFRQGDYERQLNLPVTPLCDRHATSIPKIQAGFFKFVVTPLYEEWHRFLDTGLSINLMDHLKVNQTRWEALIQQETTEEAEARISEAEEAHNVASSGDEEPAEDSGSIDFFLPNAYVSRRPSLPERSETNRSGRRHSVPISVSKTLAVPRTTIRRESLPTEQKKLRNPIVRLEDQSFLERSSLSLLSSKSSIHESSATGSAERPVSAENLLPEPSIASITNSAEATRLSTVLQPDQKPTSQTKQLTRQQTFPPLQPYSRMRYMSTTAEMSQCSEALIEGDSSASSTPSPARDKLCSERQCGTPLDSPPRKISSSLSTTQAQRKESDCSDSSTRKRGSVISELRKTEMTLSPEHARRHSTHLADAPGPTSKYSHRYRRASAQESDSTQRFYASLTSGQKLRGSAGVLLEAQSDSRPESAQYRRSSRSELKTESLLSTPVTSPGCNKTQVPSVAVSAEEKADSSSPSSPSIASKNSKQNSQVPTIPDKPSDRNISSPIQECCSTDTTMKRDSSRRYSTPVMDSTISDSGVRRYSAVPSSCDGTQKVFFIGTPPDSPPRGLGDSSGSGSEPRKSISDSSSDSVSVGSKRDSDSPRDKGLKIPKLSVELEMKENVDPRSGEDGKVSSLTRRCSQGWARRRGSAPVGLLSRVDDVTTPMATRGDRYSRRGSVPTDITRHQNGGSHRSALGPRGENLPLPRRASLPQETALGNLLANVFLLPDQTRHLEDILRMYNRSKRFVYGMKRTANENG